MKIKQRKKEYKQRIAAQKEKDRMPWEKREKIRLPDSELFSSEGNKVCPEHVIDGKCEHSIEEISIADSIPDIPRPSAHNMLHHQGEHVDFGGHLL